MELPQGMSFNLVLFLYRTSLLGLCLLRAMDWMQRKQVGMPLAELAKKLGGDPSYLYGYTVACASMGLVEMNEHEGVWTVQELIPGLSERLPVAMHEKAKSLQAENPSTAPVHANYVTRVMAEFPVPEAVQES